MTEKWWEKGDPNVASLFNTANEDALTVQSMRKEWEMIEGDGTGISIYRTPAGIFRVEEESDGTLIRLERIDDYQLQEK